MPDGELGDPRPVPACIIGNVNTVERWLSCGCHWLVLGEDESACMGPVGVSLPCRLAELLVDALLSALK